MVKKVLICASAASHILNFHIPHIRELKAAGYIVHTAADSPVKNSYIDKSFSFPYEKGRGFYKNIKTVFGLAGLIRREKYDVINTNSMLAGLLGRLGALLSFRKIRVIHVCHGYLFDDDGSLKSRLMILVERLLSFNTDLLFVMNRDDYDIARKYRLCKRIEFINGMGLDAQSLGASFRKPVQPEERTTPPLRGTPPQEGNYTVPPNVTFSGVVNIAPQKGNFSALPFFLCVGEFSKRKNQKCILEAFNIFIKKNGGKVRMVFLGDGALLETCVKYSAETGIGQYVSFFGHADITGPYYKSALCAISASRFEGLPFNVLEALYYNTPVIASKVKGHKDLIINGVNGWLYEYGDAEKLAGLMEKVIDARMDVSLDEKYILRDGKGSYTKLWGL